MLPLFLWSLLRASVGVCLVLVGLLLMAMMVHSRVDQPLRAAHRLLNPASLPEYVKDDSLCAVLEPICGTQWRSL